jgi:predicted GIY-YIG superfamily endonuclease
LVLPEGAFTAALFATGMTQNLKQRAYNHNRHRGQKKKDGYHH